MKCKRCGENNVDGRKREIYCESCLEALETEKKEKDEIEEKIRREMTCMVKKLVTQDRVKEMTERIRSTPLHQLVTRLLAYELISTHASIFDGDGDTTISLLDVFVRASEADSINVNTSFVTFLIESVVTEINEKTKAEMREKGIEDVGALGYIIGS